MNNITVIGKRILVQLNARKDISEGGIHIPDVSKVAETWGTVKAVGSEVEHRNVMVGDIVLIGHRQGTHLILGGADFVLDDADRVQARKARLGEN